MTGDIRTAATRDTRTRVDTRADAKADKESAQNKRNRQQTITRTHTAHITRSAAYDDSSGTGYADSTTTPMPMPPTRDDAVLCVRAMGWDVMRCF